MNIKQMAETIEQNGGRLYLVGGAVRDTIINSYSGDCEKNFVPKDKDYCVTGLSKEKFEELFPKAFLRGESFGVYDINGDEFALARYEEKVGEGYKGFNVNTGVDITIEDDLYRRDITINAIAIDVLTKEVIDPYNGQEDINNKVIRAVSERFAEDPLRCYRVARFASKFNFTVEENTIELMQSLKNELHTISKERVYEELKKVLMTKKPSNFYRVLKDAELLSVHFEEIERMVGVEQPYKYHPEGDVFNHTMDVIDRLAKIDEKDKSIELMFAGLTHDFGKIATPKEQWPHHYEHENNGIELINIFCNRLGLPTNWQKVAVVGCKYHMTAGRFNEMSNNKRVKFFEDVYKTRLGLDGLEKLANADKNVNNIRFAKLGHIVIKDIEGKYIQELQKIQTNKNKIMESKKEKKEKGKNKKYSKDTNIEKFLNMLHQERVAYLEHIYAIESINENFNEKIKYKKIEFDNLEGEHGTR